MKGEGRTVIVWFLVLTVLLAVTGTLAYRMGLLAIHANQRMENRILAINELANFLSILKDAETGQRGFLLTGDASYLEPYRQCLAQINSEENKLRSLAAGGDLPRADVERTMALTGEKLVELGQTVQLYKHGLAPALAVVRDNRGKQIMDVRDYRAFRRRDHFQNAPG